MSKVNVAAFSVSLDGFGAGPNQTRDIPLGERGEELHEWMFPTKMFQQMMGKEGGTVGTDNDFAERSMENMGAWIMGRNMFGPIRGPWPDDEWKGWWGEQPPYHVPVFVLTHHEREPVTMKGEQHFILLLTVLNRHWIKQRKLRGNFFCSYLIFFCQSKRHTHRRRGINYSSILTGRLYR